MNRDILIISVLCEESLFFSSCFLFQRQCYCSNSSVRATELWVNPAVAPGEEGRSCWAKAKPVDRPFKAAETIGSVQTKWLKKEAKGDLIMIPWGKLLVRVIRYESRKSHNWAENRGFIFIPQCLGALWMQDKGINFKMKPMISLGYRGHLVARAAFQP